MLLDITQLAALLRRSPETIRKDIRRNPRAVPPQVTLPGTRLLRWREEDVAMWLKHHASLAYSHYADVKEAGNV